MNQNYPHRAAQVAFSPHHLLNYQRNDNRIKRNKNYHVSSSSSLTTSPTSSSSSPTSSSAAAAAAAAATSRRSKRSNSMRRNSPRTNERDRTSPRISPRLQSINLPPNHNSSSGSRSRSSSTDFTSPLPPPATLLPPIVNPLSASRPSSHLSSPMKACGWCGSSSTTQWRIGQTDGSPAMSLLCNACGINYRRAISKSKGNVNLDDLARAMGPITAPCRPSIHKTIKRLRAASVENTEPSSAGDSNPSGSSSRKRARYSTDPLPPFDALLRSIPEPPSGQRPP